MNWKDGGAPYLPTIGAVEAQFGIPTDLLARVAYQECSWRAGVIDGSIKSSAGAIGMFQLMPQFFPGAGVDWRDDAVTAAKYLVMLRLQLGGDWQYAVAAYNWGPGNVRKYIDGQLQVMPYETTNYVAEVFGDVPLPGAILA